MSQYVTGAVIKALRQKNRMTQAELAERLCVSDKTISKWETGKGYPDISLLEPISKVLNLSLAELLSGRAIENTNVASNMMKLNFYVCPVCGNIIYGMGEAQHSCHGISLYPLEAEPEDSLHALQVEKAEDEYFVRVAHEMAKEHYISFLAAVSYDRLQLVKLYPEGNAEARFKIRDTREIYFYCNRDGLFKKRVR